MTDFILNPRSSKHKIKTNFKKQKKHCIRL